MKTIIISQDGKCLVFKSNAKSQPDKFININPETNTVALWVADPPALQIINFESFDIGERTATGEKVLFLRGNTLLLEVYENIAGSTRHAKQNLAELFTETACKIHSPVYNETKR